MAALAAGGRVPTYLLVGDGGRSRARLLRLERRLRLVASPRHATVLLVVGSLPGSLHEAAALLHDQLPAPRGALLWGADGEQQRRLPFPVAERVAEPDDPVRALVALHRALVTGGRPSAATVLPQRNPEQWRGVGPHGQGGEGMMGGKPYGRAMAMTAEDVRDGLMLDQLPLTLGPFVPWLPPGLRLELQLQGDVVQQLSLQATPLRHRDLPRIFIRAEREQVPLAELELARARHHLEATSDLLVLHGLEALAERTLRLAARLRPQDAPLVRRLARALRWSWALRLGTSGVGVLGPDAVANLGPVARAAGDPADARSADPAYAGLGFEPLVRRHGDTLARWQQRLDEAVQALQLAARAGDRLRAPGPPLEGPRGPLYSRRPAAAPAGGDRGGCGALPRALGKLAVGQSWDALATTLVGLDLDPALLPGPAGDQADAVGGDAQGTGKRAHDGAGDGGHAGARGATEPGGPAPPSRDLSAAPGCGRGAGSKRCIDGPPRPAPTAATSR